MITTYDNILKRDIMMREKEQSQDKFLISFIKMPKVEILGFSNKTYHVEFIDTDTSEVVFQIYLKTNNWATCSRQWYTNWLVRITDDTNTVINEYKFNPDGKRVYLHLDSKSLGDTLAWFPFVEEFRKIHNCKVICSTFWNELFKKNYPEITFVAPGSQVNDLYTMIEVGWFSNTDRLKNKRDPRLCSLQEIATDGLGLPYKEIIPDILIKNEKRKIKEKYVCIATASTAQAKYWNNPTGWQDTIDYLISLGYKVVLTQTEDSDLKNVIRMSGKDIQDTINYLLHCDFFVGISSGVSWLAWALRKPVILISGFTKPLTEFKTNVYRIINENVCNGCMNDDAHVFDKGDWNWCPRLKNTNRQFECSKTITFENVKSAIDELISKDLKYMFYCNCYDGKQRKLNTYNLSKNFSWDKWRAREYESSDIGIYYEIFMVKDYEYENYVRVQPNDVVLDIGANIGGFARYANELGAEKVVCYEPEWKNYQCLVKNLPINARAENVAVSDKSGLITLFLDNYGGGHSLINTDVNGSRTRNTQKIQSVTLNSILDSIHTINFIKMDVEGAEHLIFEACDFSKLQKVRNIAIEYHNMLYNFDTDKRTNFIKKFNDIGFNSYLKFCDSINHLQMIYLWK
jgi:autotransporter strand-loop-strand O-heptosyltransferase